MPTLNLVVRAFCGPGEVRVRLLREREDGGWEGGACDEIVAHAPGLYRSIVEAPDWRGFIHRQFRIVGETTWGTPASCRAWLDIGD